jgi:hypothetical protein
VGKVGFSVGKLLINYFFFDESGESGGNQKKNG